MDKKEPTVSKVISISEEMYFHKENKRLIEKFHQKNKNKNLNNVTDLHPKPSAEDIDYKSKKAA